jgi:hypothetical protein
MSEAYTGIFVAIQRVDSALRINVHFHVLAIDGISQATVRGLRYATDADSPL